MSELGVRSDNRLRLVGAVLAAGDWPALETARHGEQTLQPHMLQTREYLVEYADHPAVVRTNHWLQEGGDLSSLFSVALRCDWPTFTPLEPLPAPFAGGEWPEELADFYVDTALAAFFWSEHQELWEQAEQELQQRVGHDSLKRYLSALARGNMARDLWIMPSLVAPSLEPVLATNDSEAFLLLPPPLAADGKAERSFSGSGDWVLAETCYAFLPLALEQTTASLSSEQVELLRRAATALYLERAQDEAAALLYRSRWKQDFPSLTEATEALRTYLATPESHDLAADFSRF